LKTILTSVVINNVRCVQIKSLLLHFYKRMD
jgi:hypothetical protein